MVITAYRPLSAAEPTFPQAKVTDLFISSSYKYHKYFYQVGSFTLVVPANVPTVELISEDMILSVDGKDSLIVTDISSTEKEYTFKGYDLKYLLHLRLTLFPQKEQDAGTYGYYVTQGSTEYCIKDLIQYNITAAADEERRIYGFYSAANQDRGLESDTYMTRLEYLDEVVAAMCKNASVGYDIKLDFENNKYLFDVAEPVDRTDSQHDRNSVVFAKQFCNVIGLKRETGTSSEKNAIYAINGGGTADKVVKCVLRDKADVPAGIFRREVTVNTSAELATEVDTYALKEAEDYVKTDSFELDTAAVPGYGVLFDVGDKVTFKHGNLFLDSVILEAQTERSGDSNKVTLVAGNKKPKTLNSIGNKTGTLENNVNSAKIDGMGGDKILPLSQFAANEDGSYTVNGVNYGFGTDSRTGYINKIFDDGNTVDIDTANADVNVGKVDFNTLVMAVAISNGLNAVDTTQLMLYDSGNERVGITGGWELNIVTGGSYYGGYVTAGKSGGLLYGEITASSVRSGNKHMGNVSYTTINQIPLKGYSKVCAEGEWYIAKANNGTRDGDLLLTLFSNKPTPSTPASVVSAKYRRITDDSEFGTARNMVYEFDISDMDDSHYISVNIWGTAWLGAATSWGPAAINSYFKVSKIWLEK